MRLSLPFLPRQNSFFFLLHQSAVNVQKGAYRFRDLMENFEDVPAKVQEIRDLEEFGDGIVHDIVRGLHRTFVTPIDREDIMALTGRLDDVLDAVDDVAQLALEYRIEAPTDYAKHMAVIIARCTDEIERATALLSSRGARLRDILPMAVEVNRLENEGDKVSSAGKAALFHDGVDVIQILKWREIYNLLEEATDRAEDAADILEGIVLKNA